MNRIEEIERERDEALISLTKERLYASAERDRLRAALERIVKGTRTTEHAIWHLSANDMQDIAREALRGGGN